MRSEGDTGKELRKLATSSQKWLYLGLKLAVGVGLIAVAATAASFFMRQSNRLGTPAVASAANAGFGQERPDHYARAIGGDDSFRSASRDSASIDGTKRVGRRSDP